MFEHPPREEWEHLLKYGYAPGGYIIRCHQCKEQIMDGCDKRAITCRPCAEKMYKEDQEKTMTEQTKPTGLQRSPVVHYKTFASSDEFVKWQEENEVQLCQVMPIVKGSRASFSCTDVTVPDTADFDHAVFVTYYPI